MEHTTRDTVDWTSVEATELNAFLKTPTGMKLLRALALEEPPLLRKGDTNEILIRSGEVAQHKNLISFLLESTGEVREEIVEDLPKAYPDLTDDNQWDGPKLKEPQ